MPKAPMDDSATDLSSSVVDSGRINGIESTITSTSHLNDTSNSLTGTPNHGEKTPQHNKNGLMNNSIFNTISKIVNPTTKVSNF